MVEKKREAEAAVDLMSVQYERNCGEEEKRNGLIIVKAIYGKISNDTSATDPEQTIDVTVPLQCLVKESKLILQESSKVNIVRKRENLCVLEFGRNHCMQ